MRNGSTALVLGALLASTALATPALAQTGPAQKFATIDENGVDLTAGQFFWSLTEGTIGSGEGALDWVRYWSGPAGWSDNWTGSLYTRNEGGTPTTYVQLGPIADTFTFNGTSYVSTKGNGAMLAGSTYASADGTSITFTKAGPDLGYPITGQYPCQIADPGTCGIPTSVRRPNGMTFNLGWDILERCLQFDEELNCLVPAAYFRLRTVTSSGNYKLTVNYATDIALPANEPPPPNWYKRTNIQFTNLAGAPSPLPTITYGGTSTLDITDTGGRLWKVTMGPAGPTGIRRPGAAADTTTIAYSGGIVSSVTNEGVARTYARSVVGNTATMTVTDPLSNTRVITSDLTKGRPTSFKDELNRTTSFQYDSNSRLTRTTAPEGNYVQLAYDARGNVTTTTAVAKSGSGLANIVASASYDATCSNIVKCNKPNSTTDARGNVTDYTYDATHGGLLTVTAPAPTGGAVRPQTRFSYTQVTAVTGEPVSMLTGSSACQTTSSCTGAADETRTTTAYGTTNLLPTNTTRANGTGTLSATTTMTYDNIGNMLTVDGPLTATADTTRYRYNAARQVIGVIGPDPDGAGTLKHRATRNTYTNGLLTKVERGTVNSQSDTDWNNFAPLETVDIAFDANARITSGKLSGGGTAFALAQASYDTLGRPECSAVRMNTATYGSLPASACTLGTQGSFGPDRIAKTIYDNASQVLQQQVAVGTTDAATEATFTYSNNGRLQTLKDAENNLTTYEYDGFDRLQKTRMPNTPKGSGTSSVTDYEQLTYDANSNVTNRRLRDAQSIIFTYDKLNRPTLKNLPGGEPDVTYGYDNLGRLTLANQTGNNLSFSYDALGRNLTQVGPQATVASQWDLAGRRTKLTYPGAGLFIDYDYLVTGEMTRLRENGASSGVGVLATIAYDDLGRRATLTRGNGTVTTYTFDPVSRLASLAENFTGTTNDQSVTFAYNPASQIANLTRTNDLYAWTGHGSGSTASVANGLNQITTIGGAAVTYDSKGNLTVDPVTPKNYLYTSQNLLRFASGAGAPAVTLTYDPMMRLYDVIGNTAGTGTRFAYDGADMIAEYNEANALQRRFIHGPGSDEPLVWYEGTGTTDRRWFHADERGSVIAISDGGGNVTTINRYDEYGKPR